MHSAFHRQPRPRVTLLSAGPGDLELLTMKAVKALHSADVLLLDELVNPDIVQLAPAARVLRVGKRGGCKSTPQDFICRLMRRYALKGVRVVRVKGGDALLFGRAGEEIGYLREHAIEVDIINGVSAGFAAAAALGISLTHRDHCNGITFITAHTRDHGQPDWAALAATGTTLAIYMGMGRVSEVCQSLRAHLPANTPVALVIRASQPDQQIQLSNLEALSQPGALAVGGGPGVILIGNAVMEVTDFVDHARLFSANHSALDIPAQLRGR